MDIHFLTTLILLRGRSALQLICKEQNDLIFQENSGGSAEPEAGQMGVSTSIITQNTSFPLKGCFYVSFTGLRVTCHMTMMSFCWEGKTGQERAGLLLPGVQDGLGTSRSLALPHTWYCHHPATLYPSPCHPHIHTPRSQAPGSFTKKEKGGSGKVSGR